MQKISLDISTENKRDQKRLFSQLKNILIELPDSLIEVATHSSATSLVLSSGGFEENIIETTSANLKFLACSNSMRGFNASASDLAKGVEIVNSTLAHIVKRQSEGWIYIKIG